MTRFLNLALQTLKLITAGKMSDKEISIHSFDQKEQELENLVKKLKNVSTIGEKIAILDRLPIVIDYLRKNPCLQAYASTIDQLSNYAIKSILAIGQGPIVFNKHEAPDSLKKLEFLISQLVALEKFYDDIGGIIGYHIEVLDLFILQLSPPVPKQDTHYLQPEGLFLGDESLEVSQAVRWGVENLAQLAEIYPVGGAGDRLNLSDERTGTPLPAAILPFLGNSLLEGLIRDLQAREYLFFKIYDKHICTPIAMMTSTEKNNHDIILSVCQKSDWFGRSAENFYFFVQPLVPVLTEDGNWSLCSALTLNLKPGGHGVIWKLSQDQGVFAWLASKNIERGLVRQINNPLAGTDNSILGLAGIGSKFKKAFGFVSCERLLNSAEGTNVIIETDKKDSFEYRLTNIEYTDFAQRGVDEEPATKGSPFSVFPTNTNILFIHIPSIQQALKDCPIPGKLINLKSKVSYIDPQGNQSFLPGGRLESTMQNIADAIIDCFPQQIHKGAFNQLSTFAVFNQRCKTISTTKKTFHPDEPPMYTPEQAYFDLLSNNRLLFESCQFSLPAVQAFEDYIKNGPNFIILFHPALGPLYSIIRQKIRNGQLSFGSEIQLEIAEADIKNLNLNGSLVIESSSPLGLKDEKGLIHYGGESRCTLHQVKIQNKGIDFKATGQFWKNNIIRKEAVYVYLEKGAEFFAENIHLNGNHLFHVPPFHRLNLIPQPGGGWEEKLIKIEQPGWKWNYRFDSENTIQLSKIISK
ncbi:MAG: UTP--glucose-1-phosphate uridylyltransferase [Candidatus Protochlamydia sp.]|nr:UTP--glucose-1-phosphate uridylyltransferase [Candidatus Protochlamydia sp.]